ncbi:MAG TPA: hypothetical protein VGG07_24945 [Solirubrobacteraceae bacterium]|jgi:hypothetical protein
MRWLAATVALLCASAALVGGVYLRDRDPSSWLPPPRVAANQDARTILLSIGCPRAVCSYRLVANPSPYHWVARIFYGSGTACLDIDLLTFDVAAVHGFTGARPVPCSSARAHSGA